MAKRNQSPYPDDGTQVYGEDFVEAVNAYKKPKASPTHEPSVYSATEYDTAVFTPVDAASYQEEQPYYPGEEVFYPEEESYQEEVSRPPSMAARAAGKASADPYGYHYTPQPRKTTRSQAARVQSNATRKQQAVQRDYYEEPPRKRRRRKRHPFRNFLIFLLILCAAGFGIYRYLFEAPVQTTDGIHTRKDGFYNFLLCATDEGGMRTDTIMIATLDSQEGDVTLTSIPRDTIVDEYTPKINAVYGEGGGGHSGAEALLDTVETLLGFRPDGYAIIDYQVFRDAVDAMGGVSFEVPMTMDMGGGNIIEAGRQLLDGETALEVCRFRYGYAMADIQRQYVQQSFVKEMLKQCLSMDKLTKLPDVYDAVMKNTITDLSGANIRYLALKALTSGLSDMDQNTLPGEGVMFAGASCYGLYGQSVVDMVNESCNPYEEDLTIDDVRIMTVSGGYLVESTWRGEAFDASTYIYE